MVTLTPERRLQVLATEMSDKETISSLPSPAGTGAGSSTPTLVREATAEPSLAHVMDMIAALLKDSQIKEAKREQELKKEWERAEKLRCDEMDEARKRRILDDERRKAKELECWAEKIVEKIPPISDQDDVDSTCKDWRVN